jgi:hypothetical protein
MHLTISRVAFRACSWVNLHRRSVGRKFVSEPSSTSPVLRPVYGLYGYLGRIIWLDCGWRILIQIFSGHLFPPLHSLSSSGFDSCPIYDTGRLSDFPCVVTGLSNVIALQEVTYLRSWSISLCTSTAATFPGVMCPNAEPPPVPTHEVGMIIRYPQVVKRRIFAGVEHFLDGDQLAVVAQEEIVRLKLERWDPAFAPHIERVLATCADDFTTSVQVQDLAGPVEEFLDLLPFQGAIGLILVAREDFVFKGYFIDASSSRCPRDRGRGAWYLL